MKMIGHIDDVVLSTDFVKSKVSHHRIMSVPVGVMSEVTKSRLVEVDTPVSEFDRIEGSGRNACSSTPSTVTTQPFPQGLLLSSEDVASEVSIECGRSNEISVPYLTFASKGRR